VTDVDGNEFPRLCGGIAVTSTGTVIGVVKAIQDQAAELIHMSGTTVYYDHMTRLAERLSVRCADGRAAPVLLCQLWRGGGGVRVEAGALSHGAAEHHQLLRRVPWAHDGGVVSDGIEAATERRFAPFVPG